MTFYKTTAAFGVTACLLMASTAFGINVTNTFESATDGWVGDCALDTLATAYTAPTPAGLPTGGTTVDSKVLAVSGSATNAYNASGNHFVDMMVQVSIPDTLEDLNTTSAGDAFGAKFAIAVGPVTVNEATKGQFKYWNGSAWANVSDTNYTDGAWVRVTMKFDYTGTTKTCTVALDGNTCGTFNLLDNNTAALASIEVKGSTAIDEVVVAANQTPAFANDEAIASGAAATKKWLTANDVTWPASDDTDAIAKLDAQYKFGLAPDTSSTAATTLPLSFEQDADSTKATLSFPGFGAYGGTGSYVLQSKSGNNDWAASGVSISSANGVNTASVTLPSEAGTAVYYRILASSTPAQ